MRRVFIVVGMLLLLLIVAALLRRPRPEPSNLPRNPVGAGDLVFPPADPAAPEESRPTYAPVIDAAQDSSAARRALSRALAWLSPPRASEWAQNLESLHGGASPEFRRFARDFLAAAGDELVPLVKSLLAECESDEAKFLLTAALGASRRSDAIPLLQEFVTQKPSPVAAAAALYSIGMSGTPDGLMYLTAWLDTARDSKSPDLGPLLRPALMAIGLHGGDAVDYLLDAAARRKGEQLPSPSEVIGWIRGESAFDRLKTILETSESWEHKHGAMTALGSSSDRKALDYVAGLSSPFLVSQALLAARHLPDVWMLSEGRRINIARELILKSGVPTGSWDRDIAFIGLAKLLPPEEVAPLYERVTSEFPSGTAMSRTDWLRTLVPSFATQPDFVDRFQRLVQEGKVDPREAQRAIEIGLESGTHPGRDMSTSPLTDLLLARVKDPAIPNWFVSLAMRPVMRSGISESELSSALNSGWAELAPAGKSSILGAVVQGTATHYPPLSHQFTQPESFLESVLRTESDPALRLRTAYAYLAAASPATPDDAAMQAVSELVRTGDVGATPPSEISMLPAVLAAWYARFGTQDDLEKIRNLPDHYPLPASYKPEMRARFRSWMSVELKRALDAIRLAGR